MGSSATSTPQMSLETSRIWGKGHSVYFISANSVDSVLVAAGRHDALQGLLYTAPLFHGCHRIPLERRHYLAGRVPERPSPEEMVDHPGDPARRAGRPDLRQAADPSLSVDLPGPGHHP